MHAKILKTWAGTTLALGVLFCTLLWLNSPLEGKPDRKGPFGKFVVVQWEVASAAKSAAA